MEQGYRVNSAIECELHMRNKISAGCYSIRSFLASRSSLSEFVCASVHNTKKTSFRAFRAQFFVGRASLHIMILYIYISILTFLHSLGFPIFSIWILCSWNKLLSIDIEICWIAIAALRHFQYAKRRKRSNKNETYEERVSSETTYS